MGSVGHQGISLSPPFNRRLPDVLVIARQRCRHHDATHRPNCPIRTSQPYQTLERTYRPRLLGYKIPPPLCEMPPLIPNYPHWLLKGLFATIPLRPQHLLQHSTKINHHSLLWCAIHPRCESKGQTHLHVDGERRVHDEVVDK